MKVNELVERLDLQTINAADSLEVEITGGYTSDLLSDVMGNISEGMVWITLQTHRNIVAVASLKEVAAVILVGGAELDVDTAEQAVAQGVTVLRSSLPAFELSGRVFEALKEKPGA